MSHNGNKNSKRSAYFSSNPSSANRSGQSSSTNRALNSEGKNDGTIGQSNANANTNTRTHNSGEEERTSSNLERTNNSGLLGRPDYLVGRLLQPNLPRGHPLLHLGFQPREHDQAQRRDEAPSPDLRSRHPGGQTGVPRQHGRDPHTTPSAHREVGTEMYLQEANVASKKQLEWSIMDINDDVGIDLLDSVFSSKRGILGYPGYVEDWPTRWPLPAFHENLHRAYSSSATATSNWMLVEQVASINNFHGNIPDNDAAARFLDDVISTVGEARKRNADFNEKEVVQAVKANIAGTRAPGGQQKPVNKVNQRLHSQILAQPEPTETIKDLSKAIVTSASRRTTTPVEAAVEAETTADVPTEPPTVPSTRTPKRAAPAA